jgi:TonB family protein
MYDAWSQSGSSLDKKLMTSVWLRIARDGSITDVSLKNSSGNRAMDESVLEAARKVLRLDPPPSGLIEGDTAKVSVEFQVEG